MTQAEMSALIYKHTGIEPKFPGEYEELCNLVRAVLEWSDERDTRTVDMFQEPQ